jgi:glycosyltransferase involved in cell wall biosynthesis
MKTVYLRGRSQGGPIHSLYRTLVRCPPEGYQILGEEVDSAKLKQQPASSVSKKQLLLQSFDRNLANNACTKRVWQEARTLFYMFIKKTQSSHELLEVDVDLIYSLQQLAFVKRPWVADFEFANALVDYNDIRLGKGFVQRALASKYCRKILPWSDWAKRTLLRSIECKPFEDKIETVHFATDMKKFTKKKNDGKTRLLFIGSTNLYNYLNFEWKGGFEVIDAFLKLSKKYDDLELVVRSWVPAEIREKWTRSSNIKIYSSPLSKEGIADLYASSDVFLFPSYLNMGVAILEAMSYELPVIAVDLYDTPEAVQDQKTGLLLTPPPNLPYYIWNGAPNHQQQSLLLGIRQHRGWMTDQIVEKVSLLIEESSLRKRLGHEARHLVEHGEFSLERRNEKLKRIFDEATCVG